MLILLGWLSTGAAKAAEPYMWGVGGHVSVDYSVPGWGGRLGATGSAYVNRHVAVLMDADVAFRDSRVQVASRVGVEYNFPGTDLVATTGARLGIGRQWVYSSGRAVAAGNIVPVQCALGARWRMGTRQVGLRIFGEINLVTSQDLTKAQVTNIIGKHPNPYFGVEVSTLFGDFTPPRKTKGVEKRPLPVDDSP